MRTSLWAVAMVALVALSAFGALAGDVGASAARGAALAQAFCVECHLVAPGATGGEAGPAFAEVANRPGADVEVVRAWLIDPHPPMPNMSLGMAQIDDLGAYILSLRH